MVHKELLRRIDEHLDDLKLRNPRLYGTEERDLEKQEHRLAFEVAETPIAIPADRRYALHIKKAERGMLRER